MVLHLNSFCKRSFPAILLILLVGIIVYSNTFRVPFVLDDYLWIINFKVLKNLGNYLTNSSGLNSNPSRFVALLTLALNYHFGGLKVTGYHVVNLITHLLATLLVYTLVRLTFRTPCFRDQQATSRSRQPLSNFLLQTPHCFIPAFAALLFVVHPVQTQAVTYVVQRMTSLATLFYLLSLVLYVKARLCLEASGKRKRDALKDKAQESGDVMRRLKIGSLLAGSVFAAVLAMKTKEISFTLPFAALLYEICFFLGPWRRRLFYLLPLLLTIPIIPMSVLGTGQAVGLSASHTLASVGDQLRASSNLSRLDYLFTQFRVVVTYLRLLVLPINQNLDYAYPIFHTFFTPPVYLSFSFLLGIFALAVYLLFVSRVQPSTSRKSNAPALRLIAFGIFWFFLTLSVESSLIPILDVIAEHRLYLPSIGVAIAFSATFFLLCERGGRGIQFLAILAVAIIILSLSVATYRRNMVWGSAVGLWEDVVSKSPQKPKPLNNLGHALNKAGRPWEAIPLLKRAIAISYKYDKANFNLGRSYLLIDQDDEAIRYLRKAIEITPDFEAAINDLGSVLLRDKRYAEAASLLEKNLDLLYNKPNVHFNLGMAYLNTGNMEKARKELAILATQDQKLAAKLANFLAMHRK